MASFLIRCPRMAIPQMCWCAIHAPIVPGAVMNCRPVGVLRMEDDGGTDEKIIAVPSEKLTQRYVHARDCDDLAAITLQQIRHFFEHYKDREPNK